jgi:hypothetical protein
MVSLAISLLMLACGPKDTEANKVLPSNTENTPAATPEVTPTPTESTAVSTPGETDYAGLGLTEDEIKMLEERGVANVDSAEVASKIVGFEVATPAYVPEGFKAGKYSVNLSGAGLPEALKPKFNNNNVQIIYTYQEDRSVVILLLQAVHQSGIGDAGIRETVDICGSMGESVFVAANPDEGRLYDRLILSWEKGGVYYTLSGVLGGTLDRSSLEKMACSIDSE